MRGTQFALAFDADLRQEDVTTVTQQLFVIHDIKYAPGHLEKTTPGMAGRCCNSCLGWSVFYGQRTDFSALQESNGLGKFVVVFRHDLAGLDFHCSAFLFFRQFGAYRWLEVENVARRRCLFFSGRGKLIKQMPVKVRLVQLE